MPIITLTPMRRDDSLTLHRAGDVLTVNGTAFDFGALPEGGLLPRAAVACDWLASDVERRDGVLHLILPHGPIPPAPPPEALAILFPEPLHITADGPVALPVWAMPPEPPPAGEPADPPALDAPPELPRSAAATLEARRLTLSAAIDAAETMAEVQAVVDQLGAAAGDG